MTVRRVHLPPDRIEPGRARLTPEARHHLVGVLRLGAGTLVEVFDGAGGRWHGRIEEGLETVALGPREEARGAARPISLLFALAKGEKVDLVVQKATELGAARVVPFAAERSVVRLGEAKGEERVRRWRRIAEQAARQCGRADVPAISAPRPLEAALAGLPEETVSFAFHPGGDPLPHAEEVDAPGLAAIVGPEGGLSEGEAELCRRAGALSASLGPRVLRAETAAIVAVALLQARFGDLA